MPEASRCAWFSGEARPSTGAETRVPLPITLNTMSAHFDRRQGLPADRHAANLPPSGQQQSAPAFLIKNRFLISFSLRRFDFQNLGGVSHSLAPSPSHSHSLSLSLSLSLARSPAAQIQLFTSSSLVGMTTCSRAWSRCRCRGCCGERPVRTGAVESAPRDGRARERERAEGAREARGGRQHARAARTGTRVAVELGRANKPKLTRKVRVSERASERVRE